MRVNRKPGAGSAWDIEQGNLNGNVDNLVFKYGDNVVAEMSPNVGLINMGAELSEAITMYFEEDGFAYYIAGTDMTIGESIEGGSGTLTFAKAYAADTETFYPARVPVNLARGDVLRVQATAINPTSYKALRLIRAAFQPNLWVPQLFDAEVRTGKLGHVFAPSDLNRATRQSNIYAYGPFRADGTITLKAPHVYALGGTSAQALRLVVYANSRANNDDRPDAVVATSAEFTVPANAPAQWYTLNNLDVETSAGLFWFGIWYSSTTGGAQLPCHYNLANEEYRSGQTYHSTNPPAANFGNPSGATPGSYCPGIYVDYEAVLPATPNSATSLTTIKLPDTANVINALSGPHEWSDLNQLFTEPETPVSYRRFEWSSFEVSPGVYDWTVLNNFINENDGKGMKTAFRVRAMRDDVSADARYVPSHHETNGWGWRTTANNTWIPDWNGSGFLSSHAAFISALNTHLYNNYRTKLAWVDLSGPGQYGEWSWEEIPYGTDAASSGFAAPTITTQQTILGHYSGWNACPIAMFANMADSVIEFALDTHPYGLRADTFNDNGFSSQLHASGSNRSRVLRSKLRLRRETAVVVGEPTANSTANWSLRAEAQAVRLNVSTIGDGNFFKANLSAQQQADAYKTFRKMGHRLQLARLDMPAPVVPGTPQTWTSYWYNTGASVVLTGHKIRYRLYRDGVMVWESPDSTLALQALLPTGAVPKAHVDTFTVPVLDDGIYDVHVMGFDSTGVHPRLQMNMAGRSDVGTYPVGQIKVDG